METEKRLIDANALLKAIESEYDLNYGEGLHDPIKFAYMVEDAPTVDAVPVVHGRWEQARYTEAPLYICSKCDKAEYKQHNYCPNCGAKMDGDGNVDV